MIGGRRTFKRIVDLKAIIDCTTCPGEILTIAPTHIPKLTRERGVNGRILGGEKENEDGGRRTSEHCY